MSAANRSVITTKGIGTMSLIADAIAPMSAPMFTVFAMRISVTAPNSIFLL